MKTSIWIVVAAFVLAGGATVLLRTNQAPLQLSEITATEESSSRVVEVGEPMAPVATKPMLTTQEFRTLGAEVMSSLPTKENLKRDGTLPILVAGEKLAAISEAVENDPALGSEALLLFEGCASSLQYPDSVRALCFHHYKFLGKKNGVNLNQRGISPEIRNLAEKLFP